ncbi:MAG: dockerin type I repeat-containing protein [Oscillospiraceae bacterium]|nr:dockerin type I repeat-containing protein [Oscillospiraceae bacterium]
MKKFKSLLAVLSAVTILSASSLNVLQVNAIAKLLGTDANENEIWGGYYDELVGFDEEGNPIIENHAPINSDGLIIVSTTAPLTTPDDIINDKEISDSFEPFKFIYELLDVVNAYLKDNKDLDWRTVGDKLNLDDPTKSKVEIIAGNEESAKAIESYIESQGYSKDLLEISVNPDFVIKPDIFSPELNDFTENPICDKETSNSFESFKSIYELLDVVNAYLKDNKELDWRTVGDKLNLDDPTKSKVEIIAGNEESAKAIESYIESQGYSKDLLEISIDPDFVIQPDILSPLIPDYNGDNVTDLTDLTALSLYLIGDAEWNDSQIINFDCNADGKTNIADLAHLKQYIMCEDVKLG